MTAPTINGTRYPQPVDELLPKARELAAELGTMPSRNRLMREFRIGAPKADELRDRLAQELAAEPQQVLREVVTRAEYGTIATAEQIAAEYRLAPSVAELISGLAAVAVDRRAKGLPTDLDDDWKPPFEYADDEHQGDDEPATDPWDYAEPIGPNPGTPDPDPTADPGTDPLDIALDDTPEPAAESDRVATLRAAMIARGALLTPPDTRARPAAEPAPEPAPDPPAAEPDEQVTTVGHPGTPTAAKPRKPLPVWPVWLLMLPAFVAVWAGWVELGKLTGFGPVDLLPGFTRDGQPLLTLDTAITLPIGMETYAGYALYIWLSGRTTRKARNFAMASALTALTLGAGAQITYHLLTTPDTGTPWQITTIVACLPVAVLGMGAALAHLVREEH